MSHVFTLDVPGLSDITLSTSPAADYKLAEGHYEPGVASAGIVRDIIEITMFPGTQDAAQTLMQNVELALRIATDRARRFGSSGSYIKRRLNSQTDTYRSELMLGPDGHVGSIEVPGASFDFMWGLNTSSDGPRWFIRLIVHRRAYWEAASETQVQTTTTLENGESGANSLRFKVAAAALPGSGEIIPRIKLTNKETNAMGKVWIGVLPDDAADSDNVPVVLEAEDATLNGTYYTSQSDANMSGGDYARCDANLPSSKTDMMTWALTATQVSDLGGETYLVLAMFKTPPTTDYVRSWIRLQHNTQSVIIGRDVSMFLDAVDYVQELGVLTIPPDHHRDSARQGLKLVWALADTNSGSEDDVDVDAIILMPARYWRKLEPLGDGVPQNEHIIIDESRPEYSVRHEDNSGNAGTLYSYPPLGGDCATGRGLRLLAGVDNYIYVVRMNDDGTAAHDDETDVAVWIRDTTGSI